MQQVVIRVVLCLLVVTLTIIIAHHCPVLQILGLTQADQARILQSFNAGQYNVLVATSIAEEVCLCIDYVECAVRCLNCNRAQSLFAPLNHVTTNDRVLISPKWI